jgi:hypothetical protein
VLFRSDPPDGYELSSQADFVQLTHIDRKGGFYVRWALYDAQPAAESLEQSFAREWRETVGNNFGVSAPTRITPGKTREGVGYLQGGAEAASGNGPVLVELRMFNLGGRVVSLMTLAPTAKAVANTKPALERFIDSLKFQGMKPAESGGTPAPGAALPAGKPQPTVPAPGKTLWNGSPVVGIWVGLKNDPGFDYNAAFNRFDLKLLNHKPRWRTFLADGSFYEDMPGEGLLRIDPAAERGKPETGAFWGRWTLDGKRVQVVTDSSGRKLDYQLNGDDLIEDPKTTGRTTWWRARSPDGMRLDGTWSTSEKWDEANAGPNWTSVPIISFTRDGRFIDRGAFMYSFIDPLIAESAPRHPGQGTYEIRGFTLVLRYDDGREMLKTFTGGMRKDPAKDDRIVFIGKFPFYRQ